MTKIYHPGEIQVQERTGARALATRLEGTVLPTIAHKFVNFIQEQPLLLLSSVDGRGRSWTSVLCGKPGFMTVADEQTLHVDGIPDPGDPLSENLIDDNPVGLLLIDFATRRRLRVNGYLKRKTGGFSVETRQVYANCPRYIQARAWRWVNDNEGKAIKAESKAALTADLQQWINQADTFFVASYHAGSGADVSHRGGFGGFVQVLDEKTLVWPEYNGNGMFNTLGNIVQNPRIGLLFIDFDSGNTLQLTGAARIEWEKEKVTAFPGAERLVEFELDQALVSAHAAMLRWRFINYSPDNPWYC